MNRYGFFLNGDPVWIVDIDFDAGTLTAVEDGVSSVPRPLTAEERSAFAPPPPRIEERLAELEAEVRGMKERAAQAQVAGDAKKVRDAVVG